MPPTLIPKDAWKDHIGHPEKNWKASPTDARAAAVIDALASLDLHYPEVGQATLDELARGKEQLLQEG